MRVEERKQVFLNFSIINVLYGAITEKSSRNMTHLEIDIYNTCIIRSVQSW